MSSFIHMEYLEKNAFNNKHRRAIAPLAVVTGTTIMGLVFLSGLLHSGYPPVAPPTTTDIAIRPDFPVSTFIYERGAFSWFIGVAVSVVSGAVAFASIGIGCLVVTGGVAIAGCALAAVGTALTVVATVQSSLMSRQLRLAQQTMIYMDYADHSAKREIDGYPSEHSDFLKSVFGSNADYRFEGHIHSNSTQNAHLVAHNNGSHIPVFSFSTPQGTRLAHAIIPNADGGNFHRFGFHPISSNSTSTKRASTDSIASTEEYFTSGGIDILDCQADDSNHLNDNDNDNMHMQQQIQCSVPNFGDATELAVQVYDMTTMETIAAGRTAPFDSSGNSQLLGSDFSSCPNSLTDPQSCGTEDDSD